MAEAAAKIGRNEPCWCGSGKKYKRCHPDREGQPAPRTWEVDALLRSERDNGTCLHVVGTAGEVCGKPAIGSHTVPRKMLKQIARNGHVYHHSATLQNIDKAHGKPSPKLIGVNRASTLPVFCSSVLAGSEECAERADTSSARESCFDFPSGRVSHSGTRLRLML